MSDRPKDGGPAFPRQGRPVSEYTSAEGSTTHAQGLMHLKTVGDQTGMTLRDYFAAAALSACTINITRQAELYRGEAGGMIEAKAAYAIADAMLKAREGGQ